jgi:hypothetical protein
MEQCVAVQHVENSDWALVLFATSLCEIIPMIFYMGSGIFETAPQLKQWRREGRVFQFDSVLPERREELLKNAVTEFVHHIARQYTVVERSSVGIVARIRARAEDEPKSANALAWLEKEPAFKWLYERTDAASQAMKVLKYLVEKNKIGATGPVIFISGAADFDKAPLGFFNVLAEGGRKSLGYRNHNGLFWDVGETVGNVTLDKPRAELPTVRLAFKSGSMQTVMGHKFIEIG